jgi:hypothetical protein
MVSIWTKSGAALAFFVVSVLSMIGTNEFAMKSCLEGMVLMRVVLIHSFIKYFGR